MPKLSGIMDRWHFEYCFTFRIPRDAVPPLELHETLRCEDGGTLLLRSVHTGLVLPPSANEFRLVRPVAATSEKQTVRANVTFDTLAAFFPSSGCGGPQVVIHDSKVILERSYIFARPVYVPAYGEVQGVLHLVKLAGLPEEITITCAGVVTHDIL